MSSLTAAGEVWTTDVSHFLKNGGRDVSRSSIRFPRGIWVIQRVAVKLKFQGKINLLSSIILVFFFFVKMKKMGVCFSLQA